MDPALPASAASSASAPLGTLGTLATLDWVGLGLIVLLVALGVWRGLWWQVVRLLGIVAAVALARGLSGGFAERISALWPELSPRLANGVAWISIFLVAMAVAALLGLLGNKVLQVMQLGLANRVGGGFAGLLTGLLLHGAVLIVLCQLAPEPFVGRVVAGSYSERLVGVAGERFPVLMTDEAAREVRRLLDRDPAAPAAGSPALPAGGGPGGPPARDPARPPGSVR